jgi:ribosome biogenesis protein ENP2
MVVSLASTGGAAKIYCVNGGGMTSKNAAAWLDAKLTDKNKRRKKGGQGGTGGEGEIRLIQVRVTGRSWRRRGVARV